jgi:hypothetical protein
VASHITTGEWQSFEARMRRRRAERLALRAEVAADAGCADEARQCLHEARQLAPSLPELQQLERKLDRVQARRGSRRTLVSATAAVVMLAACAGAAVAVRGGRPLSLTHDYRTVVFPPAADRRDRVVVARTSSAPPSSAPLKTAAGDVRRESDPVPSRPKESVETPRVFPLTVPVSPSPPEPAVRLTPFASPAPAALPMEPAAPPPTPESDAAPPPEPPQDALVRHTLDRYAAAYTDLDADAARRVWPGVNRAALVRAFNSLASQEVSLGDCHVDVSGASARARCAGSATWAPKVGAGGAKTEARLWDFELVKSGDGWQIVRARAQNR